jgi:hypothetical protein
VLVQDRYTVCTKHNITLEIVLGDPDGTLSDEAQVEAHFSPFGDSANLDTRLIHGLHGTYHRLRNHFRCT